jgi:hypothetical protein
MKEAAKITRNYIGKPIWGNLSEFVYVFGTSCEAGASGLYYKLPFLV